MLFKLFLPYIDINAENESLEGYYNSPQDYINALRTEEYRNGQMIFGTMSNGGINNNKTYNGFGRQQHNVEEKIAYAKADCTLYSPNGAVPETVDSMIDKFAAQREFLVTVNFNESGMDAEFEEELSNWNVETKNILKAGAKYGNEWIDKNIPRREMRLSFQNKSNKTVNFILEKCEIEDKISRNRYVLYVNKMQILK